MAQLWCGVVSFFEIALFCWCRETNGAPISTDPNPALVTDGSLMTANSTPVCDDARITLLKRANQCHVFAKRLAHEIQGKQEEQERSLRSNAPKLQGLVQETRRIKMYVEEAISTLYSGRQINIIGEISNVV